MIDAGIKTDSNFLENLKQIIPIEKIDLLILTHGHYDHIGHAAFIQKHYGVPIAIHKADMPKVVLGKMEFPKAKSILGNIIRTTTLKEMEQICLVDTIYLNEYNGCTIKKSSKQVNIGKTGNATIYARCSCRNCIELFMVCNLIFVYSEY